MGIEWLVLDEIFDPLDFTDFDIYVNYIKEKQTNKRIFEANGTSDVLELIHTDICGLVIPCGCLEWSTIFYDDHTIFLELVTFISSMKSHSP